jgi:hypothetical protein
MFSRAPKRVVAAVQSYPPTPNSRIGSTVGGAVADMDAIEELINVGLTTFDNEGVLQPRLAEAVPTVENGLWQVFPGGRMETTWQAPRQRLSPLPERNSYPERPRMGRELNREVRDRREETS